MFFSCSYFSLKSSVTRVELDTRTHKGLVKFERWDLVFIHGLFKYSKPLPHSVIVFLGLDIFHLKRVIAKLSEAFILLMTEVTISVYIVANSIVQKDQFQIIFRKEDFYAPK